MENNIEQIVQLKAHHAAQTAKSNAYYLVCWSH